MNRYGLGPCARQRTHLLNSPKPTVARGFIPAGLRSNPKTCNRISPDIPSVSGLRLLRSRTGINPLTTGVGCRLRAGFKSVCSRQSVRLWSMCKATHSSPELPQFHCGEGIYPRWVAQQPQILQPNFARHTKCFGFTTAAQPNGDKSPHHRGELQVAGRFQKRVLPSIGTALVHVQGSALIS
ncbi:hypothetical protein ABIA53_002348 [Pseudomonas monsensis]